MPCNSIITQSVDLEKCGDKSMLWDAVLGIGATMTIDNTRFQYQGRTYLLVDGKLSGDSRFVGSVADAIKRKYSELSIYKAAKARGWVVKKVAENKLQVIRRF